MIMTMDLQQWLNYLAIDFLEGLSFTPTQYQIDRTEMLFANFTHSSFPLIASSLKLFNEANTQPSLRETYVR